MNIKIYIKSMNQSTVGFTQENNYTLEFILPKNSSVKHLLINLNNFRMPKNKINKLYNKEGKVLEYQTYLQDNYTYFIF